jgi:hypothetical protein
MPVNKQQFEQIIKKIDEAISQYPKYKEQLTRIRKWFDENQNNTGRVHIEGEFKTRQDELNYLIAKASSSSPSPASRVNLLEQVLAQTRVQAERAASVSPSVVGEEEEGNEDSELQVDLVELRERQAKISASYEGALQAMSFKDLNDQLNYDMTDQVRLKEYSKTTAPSVYQQAISGTLPDLRRITEYFKDGKIKPEFKQDLDSFNTRAIVNLLKKTADAYNKEKKNGTVVPYGQQAVQCLLFEAIDRTIENFALKEAAQIKQKPSDSREIKRKILLEKTAAITSLLEMVKDKDTEKLNKLLLD